MGDESIPISDESPSQVGLVGQDHLQAKEHWPWQSGAAGSDDNLPPGFEGVQPANAMQNKLSVPVVQWKCPSRFVLDPTWQVAAGEESKEMEFENQREMRVLEAIYPRPSAIPPNPASPMGEPYYNDLQTPAIPITAIEDEDTPPDTSSSSMPPTTTTMSSNSANGLPPPSLVPGVEPDVVSAAYSALNAAMSNTTQGNLIDPNLLIKILSDPSLIEKLVSSHGPSLSSQQMSQPQPIPTLPPAISLSDPSPPLPVHLRPSHLSFSAPSSSFGTNYPQLSRPGPVHVTAQIPVTVQNMTPEVNLPVKKDLNYYKSLVQQHGGEKPELANTNSNSISNSHKTRDMKPKVMKPCLYYNTARGCRHGSSCVFQHDSSSSRVSSSSMPEAQSAKRMKMDREITGN